MIIFSGCSNQKPYLKFSTSACDSNNTDIYSEPYAGILNQQWADDSTLIVDGYVKTYCGGADIYGDFSVEGNKLILKYDIKIGDAITSCNCYHKVRYSISNLEKKDYSISIVKK